MQQSISDEKESTRDNQSGFWPAICISASFWAAVSGPHKIFAALTTTVSFDGSYGWSFDGISSNVGSVLLCATTIFRTLSATNCEIKMTPMSERSSMNYFICSSISMSVVFLSTIMKFDCPFRLRSPMPVSSIPITVS